MKIRAEAKDYLKVEFHTREKLKVKQSCVDYMKVDFHAEAKRD